MIPYVPNRFDNLANLDVERINENVDSLNRQVRDSMSRRYHYSEAVFVFDGITNASTAAERTFPIRAPGASNTAEVFFLEVVITSVSTMDWDITCSDTNWPTLTVATAFSGGGTTEYRGQRNISVPIPAGSDLTFTIAPQAAATATRGYMIAHIRSDRGRQGSSFLPPATSQLNSLSSTAGATVEAQIDAIEDALTRDANALLDLRCFTVTVRSLAGTAVSVQLPASNALSLYRIDAYNVAPAGANLDVSATAADLSTISFTVNGVNTSTLAVGGSGPGVDEETAQTMTLQLSRSGAGTIAMAHVVVWYS